MRHHLQRLTAPADQLQLTSWLFLRLLAVIYGIAFVSLAVQVAGLAGPQGILPIDSYMADVEAAIGRPAAWLWMPSLFWLTGGSDLMLQAVAYLGAFLALALFLGRWERPALIALFLLYLSLYHACQVFTNFQWDTLLLETGFLAIFLVDGPSRLLIFLFEWLLFRLRFMSGAFKLLSGDPSWSSLTTLDYYFETQPLPHTGSWYAHLLPEWLLRSGTGLTLFSELIVPFFIFLPRPFRLAAVAITLLMQLLIIATSNHNFINLLTILLCLFLLDDRIVGRLLPRRAAMQAARQPRQPGRVNGLLVSLSALLIVPSSLIGFTSQALRQPAPAPLQAYSDAVRRYGIGNIYHVYPTMQTQRQELIIQGSQDGKDWKTYAFKYKPGDPARRPPFNVPHQPRLDWMMWFVPTQQPVQLFWFGKFMQRLHEGSSSVTALLAVDPFADRPPRYLRVLAYRYRFTTPSERAASGDWWRRTYLGEFPRVAPRRP
ncbi:MAG: lipase maturation factor family protein [Candidatus Thiodiazotropha sp.]